MGFRDCTWSFQVSRATGLRVWGVGLVTFCGVDIFLPPHYSHNGCFLKQGVLKKPRSKDLGTHRDYKKGSAHPSEGLKTVVEKMPFMAKHPYFRMPS